MICKYLQPRDYTVHYGVNFHAHNYSLLIYFVWKHNKGLTHHYCCPVDFYLAHNLGMASKAHLEKKLGVKIAAF